MKSQKLVIKDLVTIGVFLVVYMVVMFTIGMISMIPILFLVYPFLLGVLTGGIVMLFMAKVQKPWALFIFGILSPLIMFLMGHTYVVFVHGVLVMCIAEAIRYLGKYKSLINNAFAFAIFNTWICGSMMQMLLAKDKYFAMSESMVGKDYALALQEIITYPHMFFVYIGAIVGGLIGAWIGIKMLNKHFIKAGIVA